MYLDLYLNLCLKRMFPICFCLGLWGCAPTVYVIDRHTVLEEEASGDWPELESYFLKRDLKPGPTFLEKTRSDRKRERIWHVLNGELATPDSTTGGAKINKDNKRPL